MSISHCCHALFPDFLKNELVCHTIGSSPSSCTSHLAKAPLSTSAQCCQAHASCSGSPTPSLPKLPSPAQPSSPSLWTLFSQLLTVSLRLLLLLLSQSQNPLTYSSGSSSSHLPSYLYQICFLHFICSSQTTGHRFSLLDLPALLSPLLLQPQFPSQSTGFQPPNDILFCSS